MKLNEIIYDIKNIVTKGKISDDFPISESQIEFWIDNFRLKFLSLYMNKKYEAPDEAIQTLCITLEPAELNDCSVPSNCSILKSTCKIPSILSHNHGDALLSVTTVNGYNTFHRTTFNNFKYIRYRKYANNLNSFFFHNGFLYIINNEAIEHLMIRAIFTTPSELVTYNNCLSGNSCYDIDNDSYPVPEVLVSDIVSAILQARFGIIYASNTDTLNDAKNDIQGAQVKQQRTTDEK